MLEGRSNLQKLDPLRIGQSVLQTIVPDLAAERKARVPYREAREYCHGAGDFVTMAHFEELLADEAGHIDFLETRLGLHAKLGAETYMQLNASKFDEAE